MVRRRFRPSPAMVVACAALFVAIGGSSYAVTRLPARSVGTKQLKRGAVRNVNLARNAVTGAKVRNRSLTAADIDVASLRNVASAVTAANAGHATAAAALDRVVYVSRAGSVAARPADEMQPPTVGGATALCPAGTLGVGGGVGLQEATGTTVVDSFPEPGGRGWTARVANNDADAAHGFTVVAVCLAAGAVG